MIRWLKRLIAGPELDELAMRRAIMEGWELALAIAASMTGARPHDIARHVLQPDHPVTDWDVAQASEQREPEPTRVAYRFLGVTGEEDA